MAGLRLAALDWASIVGHHWAGEEHMLLALLDGPPESLARASLEHVGLDLDAALVALIDYVERVGPPEPRISSGTGSHWSYHVVAGRAEGLALGRHEPRPRAEDGLMALLWQVDGRADALLKEMGTSRVAVAASLATLGVSLPLPPPDAPVSNPLSAVAETQALGLGYGYFSAEHVLLALLDGKPDDVAAGVLDGTGLSYDALTEECARMRSGPEPEEGRARPNPLVRELLARAEGLAITRGQPEPSSLDALLATLWAPDRHAVHVFEKDDAMADAVVRRLDELGLFRPAIPVPEPHVWPDFSQRVEFPLPRLGEVTARMSAELPAGNWGWNCDDEIAWVCGPPDTDLQGIVDRALAAPLDALRSTPASEADAPDETGDLETIRTLAVAAARELNHDWVCYDHLFLALLQAQCPGRARDVLASFGLDYEDTKNALMVSMGDPFEASSRELTLSWATERILDRARVKARQRRDEEPSSEHVLLVLTEEWEGSELLAMVAARGVRADQVRLRVLTGSTGPPTPTPLRSPWPEIGPIPPDDGFARSPAGHDPWRRRPWGSVMFRDARGATFRQGQWIRQYFVDRDGYPVLTMDGRPVHVLFDEKGQPFRRGDRGILGPVNIPPGCEVRAAPR